MRSQGTRGAAVPCPCVIWDSEPASRGPPPGAASGLTGLMREPPALAAGPRPCISDITTVISGTRHLALLAAALLAADIAGASAATAALLGRRGAVAAGSVGLLVPVLLSWLVAGSLLLLAERPVAGALGELRRETGARVDPAAPWRPAGVRPMPASELQWSHVVPLIAAATVQHARARLALGAAIVTTAGLLLWLVLSLGFAAVA